MKNLQKIFLLCVILLSAASCDKGYQVRFSNYYTEEMDSVIIGERQVIFTDVPLETTTDFMKIGQGRHSVKMMARSGKILFATVPVPRTGTGNRTIQIDAIEQISILEE